MREQRCNFLRSCFKPAEIDGLCRPHYINLKRNHSRIMLKRRYREEPPPPDDSSLTLAQKLDYDNILALLPKPKPDEVEIWAEELRNARSVEDLL